MKQPEAFIEKPRRGGRPCTICSNAEIREYLKGCLQKQLDEERPRPPGIVVVRRIQTVFDQTLKESTIRRHLRECEPLWKEAFVGEEEVD